MKTLLLTICAGKEYQKIGKITHPLMQSYAQRIGADFKVIREQKIAITTIHWEKFQIYDLLDVYDRILFVDSDIIIREDAPDLFKVVPEDCVGAFNEIVLASGWGPDRRQGIINLCQQYKQNLNWGGCYFNTGVMVVSRCHKACFKKPEMEICHFYEQTYLNIAFYREAVKFYELPYQYNRMMSLDAATGEERYGSWFLHYAGVDQVAYMVKLMKRDLRILAKIAPEYKTKRHILIDVHGGLGDQVDCEPVIRYAAEQMWKGQDINVATHFPRLFKHIKGVKIFTHESFKGKADVPYYHVVTAPHPKCIISFMLSNNLCHATDFASIATFHRIFTPSEKQVRLALFPEDWKELSKVDPKKQAKNWVLLHPGVAWASRTFPKSWWQAVADGLSRAGVSVCIIGKEVVAQPKKFVSVKDGSMLSGKLPPDPNSFRSIHRLIIRKGMVDTVNQLSLGGLLALMSQARCLITNDSSPVHLAGAFDNKIILIPTNKKPEYLLPWRNGTQEYKTLCLYKNLMEHDINQNPAQAKGVDVGLMPPGKDWVDYLLDPEDFVEKTMEFLNEG